jgi:hypothetical protein
MGIINALRSGVKVASKIVKSVKATVMHEAWISQNGSGADTFAAPVPRLAIVERTRKARYTSTGILVMTEASLTFLDPIADNGSPGRHEPIDSRDRITLSDGYSGAIVDVKGVEDPGTGRPLTNTVLLGEVNQR